MVFFFTPRARHKAFCKSVDPRKASKDGILRLIRRLLPNPCLMVLIKLYAKSLLRLEEDPGAGMRNNIVFTCTTVEDCVKGGNDKDGNQMTRSVFQISKVERFAVNEPTIDFSSSISSATGPSPSDSSSLSSIVPPPSTHTASPPSNALMSPADLEAHRNQRYEGPYCYMTFKTDVPGSGGSVRSVEKVYYEMMKQMPFAMPEPVVALLCVFRLRKFCCDTPVWLMICAVNVLLGNSTKLFAMTLTISSGYARWYMAESRSRSRCLM